jgi:uncharacterized protein
MRTHGPTALTRLLKALGIVVAMVLAFDGRLLSLWASSLKDLPTRALFTGIVDPLSRLARVHGLNRPEAAMNATFKIALSGSSDGSSFTIGRTSPADSGSTTGAPQPDTAPPTTPAATPPGPSSKPDGTVEASESVFYPKYYRSYSFPAEKSPATEPTAAPGTTAAPITTENAEAGAAGGTQMKTKPRDLLFIGDSLMGSMAYSLKKSAPEHPGYSIQLEYGISSALVQSVYCDWQKRLELLLAEGSYDCVIVFLGANDGQGIHARGVDLPFDSEAWRNEYQGRVRKLLQTMDAKAGRIYWLGTPPMRKAAYGDKMRRINELIREVCAEFPKAEYLDLAPLLGDESGGYRAAMELGGELKTVRSEDGIHFTQAGAQLLTDFVFGALDEERASREADAAARSSPESL